ncbi:MAG TPA: YetF domain-containing protein [bacterium]|nr:YetF domain-containing protein [bacterium]
METVIRASLIYLFLLLLLRLTGKRTLSQLTTFDFLVLLIIGDATQQALLGQDYSITNSIVAILTLLAWEIGLSLIKERSLRIEKLIDGVPVVIVESGKPIQAFLKKTRIDEYDILAAARESQGLERMDQIKYAVLERDGKISIIPK